MIGDLDPYLVRDGYLQARALTERLRKGRGFPDTLTNTVTEASGDDDRLAAFLTGTALFASTLISAAIDARIAPASEADFLNRAGRIVSRLIDLEQAPT